MRPFVGVSCCVKSFGPQALANHAASDHCVTAMDRLAGAVPVLIPALGEAADIGALLGRLDGILLTGSRSHVDPVRYGADADDPAAPRDARRDATTLPLIRAALARGIPVLAICRGFQELNVALGGSLHQCLTSVPGRMDHACPAGAEPRLRAAKAHAVALEAGGALRAITGQTALAVNSLHHQGVDRLAPGLRVEAVAPDGTIEAVSAAGGGFALGVQWHPEFDCATDPASAAIFASFGAAMRERAAPGMAALKLAAD